MASTYITRTPSSAGNRKTFTWSGWVKRSSLGQNYFFSQGSSSSDNFAILFNGSDQFYFWDYHGAWDFEFKTNALYRDTSSWYHIVIAIDTTQATESNRVKAYINGEQITSWATASYPSQNDDTRVNNTTAVRLGRYVDTSYFDGLMSHVHFIDGTAYDASAFGETDTTTGEWKAKTSPSVTYGNNGFFILKNGNGITDQSGEGNDFTLGGGTLTDLKDNPDNVFCTGNPLARYGGNLNYANGNNHITGGGNNWTMGSATMGASTGKYYYELKIISIGTGNGYFKMGFQSADQSYAGTGHTAESDLDASYAFYCQNGSLEVRTDGAVISGYSTSDLGVNLTTGSVMCLAIDMDNKKAYFRKNGDAWIKSADPVNGTNGLDVSSEYPAGKGMVPNFAIYYPGTAALNFGNGYFGTTAVSSAGTNASDNGIFEYDVPTGYTALSTKGLNL